MIWCPRCKEMKPSEEKCSFCGTILWASTNGYPRAGNCLLCGCWSLIESPSGYCKNCKENWFK